MWIPNPGPQTEAYFSDADELFYGGAAGGGKTDLLLGTALNTHHRARIIRREGTDLAAMIARLKEINGGADGWNGSEKKLDLSGVSEGKQIKLDSCPHENDKYGFQGQDDDLKGFDEITQFTESMFRYIKGWNRSVRKGQRCRVICTGNPPSTPDGQWVRDYWGPWLNPQFEDRAANGELRWATTCPETGKTLWVDRDWRGEDRDGNVIKPKSRTFIAAKLSDNPYLGDEYRSVLADLPEPLRTQLMEGDFNVTVEDQPYQVIPTAWVRAAQARWRPEFESREMLALACDIAQGGADRTVLIPRYSAGVIGAPRIKTGAETPDGPSGSAAVVEVMRNGCLVIVDMGGGYGQSTADHLLANHVLIEEFDGSSKSAMVQNGLKMANRRAEAYWCARLMLSPESQTPIALPPHEGMVSEMTAATWKLTPRGIQIEPKDDIKARLGRSPDVGDGVIMALGAIRKDEDLSWAKGVRVDPPQSEPYDPFGEYNR